MKNRIKEILLKTLEIERTAESISDTLSLTDELNVSSLQFITFVGDLEQFFEFSLADDDSLLDCIDTIQGIVNWLSERGIVERTAAETQ